ncbi:MAG: type II toxin-antitoxin system VapC family toxin [Myxococcaceae bacterium]|nr:type II toxin-antitoxin system VapC family toxin [Myxococcaceae bacterium]
MIHFLDSSALVKRYVREPGTERISTLFRGRKEIAASRLAEVEVASALSRRSRKGDLPAEVARRHHRELLVDLSELRLVEIREPVLKLAGELVWRRSLRAYDALQLASALRLSQATGIAVTFWCADETLCEAASAEGLKMQVA